MTYIYSNAHTFPPLMPCEKAAGVFVEDGFKNRTRVSFLIIIHLFTMIVRIFICSDYTRLGMRLTVRGVFILKGKLFGVFFVRNIS